MNTTPELNALYQIYRQQTLVSAITAKEPLYPDAYLYAVDSGVSPVFHDAWCRGQDPFEDLYFVKREWIEEVLKYLDGLHMTKAAIPTFYELEEKFGKENRVELIKTLRYAFLDKRFDQPFYDAILKQFEHPTEAGGLCRPFKVSDVCLL